MKTFLTARWKNLLFMNYRVDPAVLQPWLPAGTEIDLFNGHCYASLVGFMFLDTRVKGIAVPFHRNFEEFNLRFYVRFPDGDGWKRGVVFVREIVPRRMITQVARVVYGERYYYHPMRNSLVETSDSLDVRYEFKFNGQWNHISASAKKPAAALVAGSETAFITEHYWGYTRIAAKITSEYQVAHPSWNIHEVIRHEVACDTKKLYGEAIDEYLKVTPASVFMAEGSAVSVLSRMTHRY